MANIKLTERPDGSIYLQCRCGETGQPCRYEGEIASSPQEGVSLLRQAKREAFEHCWTEHKIPAYAVNFDISYRINQIPALAGLGPFLVTTEVLKAEMEKRKKERA